MYNSQLIKVLEKENREVSNNYTIITTIIIQ